MKYCRRFTSWPAYFLKFSFSWILHISEMQLSLAFKCAIVVFRFHLRRNALVDKADNGNSRYGNFNPCPLHLALCERKEVLVPQPMLFTVQYILSTLLRILSTWENSHSFLLPYFSSVFLLTLFASPWPPCRHFTVRFPPSSFLRLFLSTALNLLPVLSNKVYGSAGVDLYREKRRNARERSNCVRAGSRSYVWSRAQ